MTCTSARRRTAAFLAATVCTGGTLLGVAAPSGAASAQSTTFTAQWSFTGEVTAELGAASTARLVDYTGTTYYDRVLAEPEQSETMAVAGQVCGHGTAYQSALNLYGRETDWANMAVGASTGARMMIACLYPDGSHHRFHWGAYRNSSGHYVTPSSNCLVLKRETSTTYSVRMPTDKPCDAQDEVVDPKPSKQLSSTTRPIPFGATVTLSTAPAVRR